MGNCPHALNFLSFIASFPLALVVAFIIVVSFIILSPQAKVSSSSNHEYG
jgi:hypothetical protein